MKNRTKNAIIGYNNQSEWVKVEWNNSSGILIAGIPGSGKSNTAAFLLSGFAFKGVKIILCDYNAAIGTAETLLDRTNHLEPAFIMEPATTRDKIVEYINIIKDIGDKRYRQAPGYEDHYPIVFVIDEFPAFIKDYKPELVTNTKVTGDRKSEEGETKIVATGNNFLDELLSAVWKFRKVNIRLMLIGQEWAQMGTAGIRALREGITNKVIHRMNPQQATLFGYTSTNDKKRLQVLATGQCIYQEGLVYVPELTDEDIENIKERLTEYEVFRIDTYNDNPIWSEEDELFLQQMVAKYQPIIDARYNEAYQNGYNTGKDLLYRELSETIDSRQDLIGFLIDIGKSKTWVSEVLKGRKQDTIKEIDSLIGDNVTDAGTVGTVDLDIDKIE